MSLWAPVHSARQLPHETILHSVVAIPGPWRGRRAKETKENASSPVPAGLYHVPGSCGLPLQPCIAASCFLAGLSWSSSPSWPSSPESPTRTPVDTHAVLKLDCSRAVPLGSGCAESPGTGAQAGARRYDAMHACMTRSLRCAHSYVCRRGLDLRTSRVPLPLPGSTVVRSVSQHLGPLAPPWTCSAPRACLSVIRDQHDQTRERHSRRVSACNRASHPAVRELPAHAAHSWHDTGTLRHCSIPLASTVIHQFLQFQLNTLLLRPASPPLRPTALQPVLTGA